MSNVLDSKHSDTLPDGYEWFIFPTAKCAAGIARRTIDRKRENLVCGNGMRYHWLFVRGDGMTYQRSNERSARQELARFKRGLA